MDRWIHQWADTDRVAFHFEGTQVTYAELAARIDTTRAGLIALGVSAGDRVGFCGLNRVELFETLFATAALGAIFVPFNNRLTAAELATQIEDSAPTVLLATDGLSELLKQATDVAVRDLDKDPFEPVGQAAEMVTPPDDSTVALMVYTSGTTGASKGALLTHDAMVHTVLNGIAQQELTAADCIVAPLPTFHVGGLNIQTLPALYVGAQVVLMRRFDPVETLELIAVHRATQTLLVPAMLTAIAQLPAFDTTDLSNLVGINSGSSVVPQAVMQPYFDRGIPVGQVYGTTETGPTAVVLRYDEAQQHVGSCGRPALHTQLRIVDAHGDDVQDGTAGELLVKGPNIFCGYWNNPVETDLALSADGWFRTGDIGHRDADSYITISDRIKDVVISGGENIYPAELEAVLAQHPAIAEVAVVAEPNEHWGEIPVAVVVLVTSATLTIEELRVWAQDRLARFKLPRGLRVVGTLPRTALGKVKKHELR